MKWKENGKFSQRDNREEEDEKAKKAHSTEINK